MLDNYKAVIFDWDGTLVDTCGLILDAHNHVRAAMGHDLWTMDDFLGRASKSAREYYPEIYGDKAEHAQKILYEFVEEHHLNYLEVMPMAKEALDHVSALSIPMAIVSNKRHSTLHIEIDHMGWGHHFTTAIGAGHAQKDKPSPDPLLMAIKAIHDTLTPQDILYVGDTETDLLTAQNSGCPVALIQSDKPRPDLIAKYNPNYAYTDLASFLADVTTPPHSANAIKSC